VDKISTLENLIEKLDQCSEEDYPNIASMLDLSESECSNYEHWLDNRYSRILISRNKKYELLLLCWGRGQDTPIHCHNSQECWVYAVEGSLSEKRYSYNEKEATMQFEDSGILNRGEVSFMSDEMGYHSLSNTNTGRSMTLHLYVNPIAECRIYDSEEKTLVWKTLHYDNVLISDK
jgi:cysteine dioxygenase